METKVLQVFYGKDCLPYKDKERSVHFPIVGAAIQGASNTTKIRFYFDELVEEDDQTTTWVVVSKLPNGKIGSEIVETALDTELNEHYALFTLKNFYTQAKGDLFLSLQGYQGGVQVETDPSTGISQIIGTPTIQATGSIKLAINYATQLVGSGETSNINFQKILADLGTKLGIREYTERVTELPTTGQTNVFYAIYDDPNNPNKLNIYVWNGTTQSYVWVGDNTLYLGEYYTKEEGETFEEDLQGQQNDFENQMSGDIDNLKLRVGNVEGQITGLANGSPSGVYADVSSLTTAHPTGDNKIYVCLDTGDWYYWNGSAWTSGGTYLSTGDAVPSTRKIADLTLEQDISRDELNNATGLGDIIENHTFLNKKDVIVAGTSTYESKSFDFPVNFSQTTKVSLHIDSVVGKTANPYAFIFALDSNDQAIEYVGLYDSSENNTISLNCTTATKKIRIQLYPASGTAMPTGSATFSGITAWYGDTPIYIGDNAKYPRLDAIETNANLIPEIIQDNSYIFKKDIVVSGSDVYVSKSYDFEVDLAQETDFSLHIDSVSGNTTDLCAFIFALDENGDTIEYIGLYYGTSPNNTITLACSTATKKVRFQLYPASGTAMPTGSATYTGVTAWRGEYPVFIKDSAPYPRLDRIEKQVGIVVGATEDYTTIQSAVNAAHDGETILIENGTYNEAVKLCGATGNTHTSVKNLTLKGFNRDACILTYSVGDYDNPPLEIAVGVVENLTIQTTGYEYSAGSNQYAYCVHIDFGLGANKCIEFRNCRFKATMYPCVGLGIRQGQKVTFTNCIFEGEQTPAFLFHEVQQSNVADAYIEFNNCTFISGDQYETIHVQETSEYVNNNVNVTFMRCIVKNTNNGQLVRLYDLSGHAGEGNKWLDSTRFTLTPISDLNSNEVFDYD